LTLLQTEADKVMRTNQRLSATAAAVSGTGREMPMPPGLTGAEQAAFEMCFE
jgi:hypothetical protein